MASPNGTPFLASSSGVTQPSAPSMAHRARVDQLQLAVALEGLRVRGQAGGVPAVVAGELAGQVARGGVLAVRACDRTPKTCIDLREVASTKAFLTSASDQTRNDWRGFCCARKSACRTENVLQQVLRQRLIIMLLPASQSVKPFACCLGSDLAALYRNASDRSNDKESFVKCGGQSGAL